MAGENISLFPQQFHKMKKIDIAFHISHAFSPFFHDLNVYPPKWKYCPQQANTQTPPPLPYPSGALGGCSLPLHEKRKARRDKWEKPLPAPVWFSKLSAKCFNLKQDPCRCLIKGKQQKEKKPLG